MESGEVIFDGVEKAVEADEDGFHSISNDWGVMFGGDDVIAKVKKLGIQGHLRGCCFRSVCWKVYLGVLPDNRSDWVQVLQKKRQEYRKIKQEYLEDPRGRGSESDASFNNPLSLDTESPWNQFFQDEELKKMVTQDVDRTYPDMDFFQMDRIKTLMTNVLFCFARAHPDLGYRQGMHELLAPFLFVLDSDKRERDTVPAGQSYTEEMLAVLDSAQLEADAYVLLAALMETCTLWYEHGPKDVRSGKKSPVPVDSSKLFQGEEDANPSSAVVRKLEKIQQVLIKKEDPELHSHLQKLAIPPQIFGLRWIRLLFAREFGLMDILLLWDAILAHSQTLDLVDDVALAMILFIRDPLISGTYISVLQLLLNFPVVADVQYIIQRALFLNNPNLYPRPPNWQLQHSDTSTTLSAPAGLRQASRMTAVRTGVTQVTQGARSLAGKTASLFRKPEGAAALPRSTFYADEKPEPTVTTQPRPTQQPATNPDRDPASVPASPSFDSSSFAAATASQAEATSAVVSVPEKAMGPIALPPAEQLSRWLDVCKLGGEHMNQCLKTLESQLVSIELPSGVDDKVFLAIAGIKQVRDLMRGTLGYDITVADAEAILSLDVDTATIKVGGSDVIVEPSSEAAPATTSSAATEGESNADSSESHPLALAD